MRRATHDDSAIDRHIGILLRTGMLVSAAVVLLGGVAFLAQHGEARPDYRVFSGQPATLRHIAPIASAAWHGQAQAIIQFGLLLLIATPIARVVFSVAAFALERDWLYVAISGVVLAVLLYSLLAHAG